jgi:hypothetical protein
MLQLMMVLLLQKLFIIIVDVDGKVGDLTKKDIENLTGLTL